MFDGPFRSYQDQSTQRCMEDLMDGYFPSELQQRFPDGVPLEVCLKRLFLFGQMLTTDQFLSKLPKVVVKAGNVIHIRSSMRRTLQVSLRPKYCSSALHQNHPSSFIRVLLRLSAAAQRRSSTHQPLITLKLKSEDGNHIYVMKMSPSETVGQLRAYLDIHRGAGQPDYDIISAYPPCSFSDDGCTLQSCGLSSNATLLLLSFSLIFWILKTFETINRGWGLVPGPAGSGCCKGSAGR
uniref:UBX domain-containing protein 11 n=1 Tax=Cyprinodon variegatus TaxID=28743 RepID=A0A3Q2DEA6_CYPVA